MADGDNAVELHKLAALRDNGMLTPSEYEAQENKILRPPVAPLADDAEARERRPRRRRRMAERGNFTAILALLCAIVFWPAGIVLAYQARREASQTIDGDERLALVALVVAYAAAIVTVVLIVLKTFT
jgi:hypothetical protein